MFFFFCAASKRGCCLDFLVGRAFLNGLVEVKDGEPKSGNKTKAKLWLKRKARESQMEKDAKPRRSEIVEDLEL